VISVMEWKMLLTSTCNSPQLSGMLFALVLANCPVHADIRAGQSPELSASAFEEAAVDSSDGRTFTVSWHAPGARHVRIYAGTDPQAAKRGREVASGAGDGRVTVANLPSAARWYFELVADGRQSLVLADRTLHLTTAANFRDVGGYRTADGHWVRMGLAYRSNGLEHLTSAELDTLEKLGLKLVCDLRTDDERRRGPDRLPVAVKSMTADVMGENPDPTANAAAPGTATPDPAAGLTSVYRSFVSLESARKAYHLLFERLADRSALPTVFHCSAGKDRTGWAAAVLLTLLHVSHATVLADYQLTDRYLDRDAADAIRRQRYPSIDDATWHTMLATDPAYLEAAFDEATKRYGSFEGYLHHGLGLDDATLDAIRRNFLTD
jgi:protein-tyrosine phosphatase